MKIIIIQKSHSLLKKVNFTFLLISYLFQNQNSFALCEIPIQHFENNHNLPKNMLRAIALVESGRTIAPNVKIAWPWTINVDGQGYMYPSKNHAIQAVKEWLNKGKKSIDVGCMQINLKQHPKAFSNLDSAFDPYMNVSYAVKFLKRLYNDSQDWLKTIAHYHSKTEKYGSIYQNKVLKTIQNISDINIGDIYKNIIHFNNIQNQKSSLSKSQKKQPHKNYSPKMHQPHFISKVASSLSAKPLTIRHSNNRKFISFNTRNIKASVSMRRKFLPLN